MIRYRYAELIPPAPMVHVTLRCPNRGVTTRSVVALIDTGADQTVLPRAMIDAMELVVTGVERVQGFAGQIIELGVYVVELSIHDSAPLRIEALVGEQEKYVLLGRDVLNAHRILLDGPQLALEVG